MGKELGFKFAGTLKVQYDRLLLQVSLHLSKDGHDHWDESRLWKLLADSGVKEGFDKTKIALLVDEFQRSRETEKTVVIAQGTLPEPPKPESFDWDKFLPLPPELAPIYEKILQKHPSPEVYRVERQGPEKKEVRVRAQPGNPTIKSFTYAEPGKILAALIPGAPGKPGKDLEGKPVQPGPSKDSEFLLGSQLRKGKDGLQALEGGFLRVGEGWADLIPYQNAAWDVTVSKDKINAYLNFTPGTPDAPEVTAQEIISKALEGGLSKERLLDASEIDRLLKNAVQRRSPLMDQPLTPDRDGFYRIDITVDKLKATLTLQKPSGKGEAVPTETILKDISSSGFKGLDIEYVKRKLQDFFDSEQMLLEDFLLISGRPPTRGKDRTLVFKTMFVTAQELADLKARLEASPQVLKTVPQIQAYSPTLVKEAAEVRAGQVMASFEDQEEGKGEEGLDIFGNRIPPYPGNDPRVTLLGPIRRTGSDLVAAEDGLLETWSTEEVHFLRIRPHRSAEALVERSADNMEAWITITPPIATGLPMSEERLKQALEEAQVRVGIDHELLKKCLHHTLSGKKVPRTLIARGRPPASDFLKRIQFQIPVKGLNGAATKTSFPWKGPVKPGEVVALYVPPTSDTLDGEDIMGNLVPAATDTPTSLKWEGPFTIQDSSIPGEKKILATQGGEVIFDGQTLILKDKMLMPGGVSKSLKFPGTILVDGPVAKDIYILAGGDLKVRGIVGSSLLSADASIQIAEGVKGEGKAVLRAKKSIAAGFFEKCHIMSVGDTVIGNTALGCQIRCNSRVFQKGAKGTVVGCKIKTKFGVDAINLGSPQKTETLISFGQDYLVEDQILVEEKEIENIRAGIVKLDALMKELEKIQAREKLDTARHKKVLLMKLLQKRGLRLINLRDKFEIHFPSEILIRGTIFPGVIIESHGRHFSVTQPRSKIKLTFNQQTGHIEESPLQ